MKSIIRLQDPCAQWLHITRFGVLPSSHCPNASMESVAPPSVSRIGISFVARSTAFAATTCCCCCAAACGEYTADDEDGGPEPAAAVVATLSGASFPKLVIVICGTSQRSKVGPNVVATYSYPCTTSNICRYRGCIAIPSIIQYTYLKSKVSPRCPFGWRHPVQCANIHRKVGYWAAQFVTRRLSISLCV